MIKVDRLSYSFLLIVSCVLCVAYGAEAIATPFIVFEEATQWDMFAKFVESLKGLSRHTHVWPELEVGWRVIVGTIIAFLGAAYGSVGGEIFVLLLTLLIGFDVKSSAAISKCMIMGLCIATVCSNLRQRHPILRQRSIIDYDLALIVTPMLLLGISIGVTLNIIFANWMVTVLLVVAFFGTATRSFFKGVQMRENETLNEELARHINLDWRESREDDINIPLVRGPSEHRMISVFRNVNWKQLCILITVWLAFLAIKIFQDSTDICSVAYWGLNLLQIPVAVGATLYQAITLSRRGASDNTTLGIGALSMRARQHIFCAFVSLLAGIVGGLLGLGGGFLLGPLFLDIGIVPQVSRATVTFVMSFSASMCTIQYYLLNRFPVPYAAYMTAIAVVASITGQFVREKLIPRARRTSLTVFILASIIFASAILLGAEGIMDMIYSIKHNENMGFEHVCHSRSGHDDLASRLAF